MEKRVKLELLGITYNQIESGVYALILQESGGKRRLPIVIGFPEAQAIECKLQEVATPRPLTHDTMAAALASFGISLIEVNINKLPTGVFTADLIFSDGTTERRIDSRSSDGVALAIRVGAPIYTTESVMASSIGGEAAQSHQASVIASSSPLSDAESFFKLSAMSLEQLRNAMAKASAEENYEEAAKIKAEIDSRNNNLPYEK